jgi:hypothetical protein
MPSFCPFVAAFSSWALDKVLGLTNSSSFSTFSNQILISIILLLLIERLNYSSAQINFIRIELLLLVLSNRLAAIFKSNPGCQQSKGRGYWLGKARLS